MKLWHRQALTQMNKSGLLLIDKPSNMTSHDVVNRVRRITGEKKVGHAGTLDPIATGLLIILVGKNATRLSAQLMGHNKTYLITMALGMRTETLDIEGHRIQELDPKAPEIHLPDKTIEEAASTFIGTYDQEVPWFSAVKVKGNKLYELARKGDQTHVDVAPPSRKVTVYSLTCHPSEVTYEGYPQYEITAHVSSGTYTRSLVRDIGQKLGIPTVQTALRRTQIGPFSIVQAIPLEKIQPSDIIPIEDLAVEKSDSLVTPNMTGI